MIIGFTGTRFGMTPEQLAALRKLFTQPGVSAFHHGDCRGSDEQAARLAAEYLTPGQIAVHPPSKQGWRANCGHADNVYYRPRPYLDRNQDIVDASDLLIATPKENFEVQGGGTWYTIRYARECHKPLRIVWTDGHVTRD